MLTYSGPGGMRIEDLGAGARVVLVHGGGAGGADAWKAQLGLAEHFRLVIPTRLGYPGSPAADREDFEVDAVLLAELLGDGAHLVGHSYGAVAAMLAAAARPSAVLSLTVIDAASSGVARGHPAVDAYERDMQSLVASPPADPSAFVRAVFAILDARAVLPDPLPPGLVAFGRRLPALRWPWEAEIPMDALAAGGFPTLVISGGRNPLYEVIADVLEARLGAERFVLADAGHSPANAGEALTERLHRFLGGKGSGRAGRAASSSS
ncbi:MAG TPA: alpha/beta fold hydrolase [Kofleriaceae bacterium]|nr:alpha/beta fold hydrolase [Kofleriaceae bacterium]